MTDFVHRTEFDDALIEIRDHRRAQSRRLADLERWFAEANRRENVIRAELIFLRRMLRSVMTDEQRCAFEAERRAGVIDGTEADTIAECIDTVSDAGVIDDDSPHVWRVGDVCHVVIQEFARADSPRCWQAFRDEAEAQDFAASIGKVHRPNDCDAVLVRVTLAQVRAVDTFSNNVTAFDESLICI